jgi:hypothetical protein
MANDMLPICIVKFSAQLSVQLMLPLATSISSLWSW